MLVWGLMFVKAVYVCVCGLWMIAFNICMYCSGVQRSKMPSLSFLVSLLVGVCDVCGKIFTEVCVRWDA